MEQNFGAVVYDGTHQRLRDGAGAEVHLRPRTLAVLDYLARQEGRVVCKDELLNAGWGEINVSEDSLYQCITEIRRALDDGDRTILSTVPKRGYRLATPRPEAPVLLSGPAPIRYTTSRDGVRIAWTESGAGIPLLKAPNWISHLGAERRNLLYAPFYERLGHVARVVRYDQRGNGMSDWDIPPFTFDAMIDDMEAVVDAAGLERFALLGLSQGVAFSLAFAARHPGRVLGIIGRGGYACGPLATGHDDYRLTYEAGVEMIRKGWTEENPAYRRFFTARIAPDATPEMARQYDEMQRVSVPPSNILELLHFNAHLDIRHLAGTVDVPVLLTHSLGDRLVPFREGQELAEMLPNVRFIPVEGENHAVIPGTPAFEKSVGAMTDFLREIAEPTPMAI